MDLHKRLTQVLLYEQDTGKFTWKQPTSNRVKPGAVAGSPGPLGHLHIQVDGKRYAAHRIAWFYVHQVWPVGEVDHINGNAGDNRIVNLRDVPGPINRENVRKPRAHSSTGVLGAFPLPGGKFRARIRVAGRAVHLGVFHTAEEAHARYVEAKRALHIGCTL